MKRPLLIIALISLTLIPLELVWTRIFSAEFFYTFAFLVLSLAVLGLGLGALAVRLYRSLDRPDRLGLFLALAALGALVGPPLVFVVDLDFSAVFADWLAVGNLLLTIFILMINYFFAGIGLALLFKYHYQNITRLYMADLVAAGVGVLFAVLLMNWLGTPAATFLITLPIILAAIIAGGKITRGLSLAFGVAAIVLAINAAPLLERERPERAPVIYTHWDALAKIKLYAFSPEYRGLNIDNVANSPVYRFNGDWSEIDPDSAQWGIDVSYLIQQFDSCVFLSLGAGGGSDVLQALVEGATEVHAVEVNGHINDMMLEDDISQYRQLPPAPPDTSADSTVVQPVVDSMMTLADFSGRIYHDPRVTVVTDDARAYVRRFENKFDVIYSLSSNTWAALASGAFALAENYLFTTEAFQDYWRSLSDSGYLMMEHQVYVPRLVSEVLTALRAEGVDNPEAHLAVYNLPQMRRKIILLSKQPMTEEVRANAIGPLTEETFAHRHLLYPPASDSLADNQINQIVQTGWEALAPTAPVDISPVTDDRPFVAQLGRWENLTAERLQKLNQYAEFAGFPLSRLLMIIILLVIGVILLPITLLPYTRPGRHLQARPWLYFFAIGAAFMAVEVVLIQKYALLIGASLYSFITVLLVLLVASGLGSRFADRVSNRQVFLMIIGWILFDAFVLRHLAYIAGDTSLPVRLLLTTLAIAPLGFFMGMPFPKATLRVRDLVDWGLAVNGMASVLGSIVALLIAFSWGFTGALLFAALLYTIAWRLLAAPMGWGAEIVDRTQKVTE